MKNFFSKIAIKLNRFMSGRYGADEFSLFLLIVYFVLSVLALLPYCAVLYSVALSACVFSLFRCFSRNIYRRNAERTWFLGKRAKLKSFFKRKRRIFKERKTHRFFKCKRCGAVLRVPKGKGRIEITCPKCKNKLTKKT